MLLIYNDSKGGKFHWSGRTSSDFLRHVLSVFSTLFFCPNLHQVVVASNTWSAAQVPPAHAIYNLQKTCFNISREREYIWARLTLCLSIVYYFMCISLQFLLELGPQRGIHCKTWSCHLLRAYNFLMLPVKLFIKSSLICFFSRNNGLIPYAVWHNKKAWNSVWLSLLPNKQTNKQKVF